MTETIAREDTARIHEASIAVSGSQTASGSLDEQGFSRTQQRSIDSMDDLAAMLRPWEGFSRHERRQRMLDSRVSEFHAFFGSPGTDEYEAGVDKILAKLKEEDVEVLDEDEVIMANWRSASKIA